jgi:hypothetical protein
MQHREYIAVRRVQHVIAEALSVHELLYAMKLMKALIKK